MLLHTPPGAGWSPKPSFTHPSHWIWSISSPCCQVVLLGLRKRCLREQVPAGLWLCELTSCQLWPIRIENRRCSEGMLKIAGHYYLWIRKYELLKCRAQGIRSKMPLFKVWTLWEVLFINASTKGYVMYIHVFIKTQRQKVYDAYLAVISLCDMLKLTICCFGCH